MNNATSKAAGAAAGLVLLTVGADAQSHPSFATDSTLLKRLELAGLFGRTDSGRILGTTRVDVVVMVGDKPVLLIGPEAYNAAITLPTSANDAAVLPGPGTADDILAVGAAGLARFTWSPTAKQLVATPVQAQGWRDTLELEVADLDGDGLPDVLGLDAGGVRINTLYGTGPSFAPGPTIVATLPVDDVVPLDLDGDGDLEVACLTADGLEVYEPTGELAGELRGYLPGGFAARIRSAGGDQIAFVVPDPNGGQELLVADAAGIIVHFPLGGIGAVACVAGDLDGDGDQDLVVSHQAGPELLTFVNRSEVPGAPLFDPGALYTLLVDADGYDPGQNQARPLVVDIDGDGDLDVMHPLQGADAYAVATSREVNELLLQPKVLSGRYEHDDQAGDGWLALLVKLPDDQVGMTHLEFCVWRRPDPQGYTEPLAFHCEMIDLDGAPQNVQLGFATAEPDYFETIFAFELRLVALDQDLSVDASRPTATPGFALAGSLEALLDLAGLPPETEAFVEIPTFGFVGEPGQNSASGGGVAPLPGVPDLPPDEPPDKPEETP